MAILKQHKISTKILDMRIGYGFGQLFKTIDKFRPDVVGVTSYSYLYKKAYEVVDKVKSYGDHIVILGGPHVSALRGKVLEDTQADFAAKGESEYTLLELCEAISTEGNYKEIKGLIWRDKNSITENVDRPFIQDLDSLPFPAYEDFELEKYGCYSERRLPIITSRGCPYQCIFCAVKMCMGNRFRARSPENVVDEMEYWYRKGWKNFDINDDCFTFDLKRAEKICDLILERDLRITYDLYNGIRVNKASEEVLLRMKNSGCRLVQYGIEAGNQEVLKKIKKGITIEQAKRAVELTKKVGIPCVVNFIIGHPGETFDRAMDSIRLAEELPVDSVCFYNLVPYPGTELFEWVKSNARLLYPPEVFLSRISYAEKDPIFETDDFSVRERRRVLKRGFQLYRKKVLQFRLGKTLGYLVYLLAKFDVLWRLGTEAFVETKLGSKVFNFVSR